MNIRIFVEGLADVKFIQDYVLFLSGVKLSNKEIIQAQGWTTINSGGGIGEMLRNKMLENADGINLIIFDADNDLDTRRKEIELWKTKYELEFDLFLFPNNKEKGALENLLEKIINPKNAPIFECWEKFESCLSNQKRNQPLTIPAKKSKLYCYLETLVGEFEKDKIKDHKRDFFNKEHWNLEAEELNPLKCFLQKYLA